MTRALSTSPASAPVTIYLDTQDYSRFGKVICRKGDFEADEKIFQQLKDVKARGLARFVYSYPILLELLQYHPDYETETFARARAVEELCGDSALVWLPRLVETQASAFARSVGIDLPDAGQHPCIRTGNEWFPSTANEFRGFKQNILSSLDKEAANYPQNRRLRRAVEANKRDRKLVAAMRAKMPEFVAKYGIPAGSVRRALEPLLRDKCTAEEASRLLFGAVARVFPRLIDSAAIPKRRVL